MPHGIAKKKEKKIFFNILKEEESVPEIPGLARLEI